MAIIVLAAVALVIYSVIKNSASSEDDEVSYTTDDIVAAFTNSSSFKEAVSSLGSENVLPDDDGYYYVWFEDDESVETVAYDDMNFVSGYVYGENSCCITVYADKKYGRIVGYDSALGYDILEINVISATGSYTPSCEGIEADFAAQYLLERYGDCAFISGGKLLCVRSGELQEADGATTKSKLYVIDTLTSDVISLISSCAAVDKVVIYDCGDYIYEGGCIFAAGYSSLAYVFPFVTEVSCPAATSSVLEGAFANADKVTEIAIPCCGRSLYSIMGGYSANLKSVSFTSLVLEADDLLLGFTSIESLSFGSGFTSFEKGYFDGLNLKNLSFGADVTYLYLDLEEGDGAVVRVPFSCVLEGSIAQAEYSVETEDGIKYKVFKGTFK